MNSNQSNYGDRAVNIFRLYGTTVMISLLFLAGCANAEKVKMNSTNHIVKVGEMMGESGYSLDILSFHPSGKYLAATSGVHGKVFVFDIELRKVVKTLDKGDTKNSDKLTFSSDGNYLIGQSEVIKGQRNFRLWDVTRDYTIISDDKKYRGSSRIYSGPDNKIYSYSGWSRNISKLFIHSIPDMQLTEYWHDLPGPRMMSISPDGKYMVDSWVDIGSIKFDAADNHVNFRVWKYPELTLVKEIIDVANGVATSFAWTSDSRYLMYGTSSTNKLKNSRGDKKKNRIYLESMRLFDTSTWGEIGRVGPMENSPIQLGFLENEDYVVALTSNWAIDIWNRVSGRHIERYKLPKTAWAFNGLQNPVNKNQFVYNHKDQLWIFEMRGLDIDAKGE